MGGADPTPGVGPAVSPMGPRAAPGRPTRVGMASGLPQPGDQGSYPRPWWCVHGRRVTRSSPTSAGGAPGAPPVPFEPYASRLRGPQAQTGGLPKAPPGEEGSSPAVGGPANKGEGALVNPFAQDLAGAKSGCTGESGGVVQLPATPFADHID